MSGAVTRVGIGTRFRYDGETVTVEEMVGSAGGIEVLVKDGRGRRLRLSLRELLISERARLIPEDPGPASDDRVELATTVLAGLTKTKREETLRRAAHVRELLTGYRSGSELLAAPDEPKPQYLPSMPLMRRYQAKADELGIGVRTLRRWVGAYETHGEAGLVEANGDRVGPLERADDRWVQTAQEVMVEHTGESKPSRTMVIERTRARVIARFGPDVVTQPSRATAFRLLEELERRHPTFRLSTKRNRDIADRPKEVYGKLRPTRPGEYLLMDTTRLDVFAFDPFTLKWVQAELTVGMDWYTRCITGLRLTQCHGL